nr:DsbA family protein [Nitrosomonas nitrosa]
MSDTSKSAIRFIVWMLVPLVVVIAAATWFFLDPGFRAAPSGNVSEVPKAVFEQRVREYLLEHPEVIIEAIERYQERKRAAEQSEAQAVLKARADEIFRDPDSPVGGNTNGDATLVEYFDYNCPYCRRVGRIMIQAEAADPKLRIVYKEFPILGPNSVFAARAALAAHRQGRYIAFHKALMAVDGVADKAKVMDVAAKIGLDLDRLKRDMDDPAIQKMIDRNIALAQALRINGTPSFVAGDQIVRGAVDLSTLQTLIREAREKK